MVRLNMYLNLVVHGSIHTEDKNSTSEGGEEDREVTVGTTYVGGARLLHSPKPQTKHIVISLILIKDIT
jgi:hypothetical protein